MPSARCRTKGHAARAVYIVSIYGSACGPHTYGFLILDAPAVEILLRSLEINICVGEMGEINGHKACWKYS